MLGGVWADRLPRHRVMVATDLIRAATHALLAALIFTGAVEIWHIVVIEAVFGAAEAFFRPAYTGLMPQTVPEDAAAGGQRGDVAGQTVAEFAGPALATALVLGIGAGWAFALDAATFVVSAAFLIRDAAAAARRGRAAPSSVLVELREGWTEFRARAWVWGTVAIFCFLLIFAFAPYIVLGPTVAEEVYGGAGFYGVLAAALGAGTIAGALIGLRWRPRAADAGRVRRSTSAWPAAIALFAAGAPRGRCWSRCSCSPAPACRCSTSGGRPRSRSGSRRTRSSRVSSYDWMGSLALLPLGYLLAGPDRRGARAASRCVIAGGAIGVGDRRARLRHPRRLAPSGRCRRRGERRHCGGNRNFARTAGFPTAP